MRVFQQSLKKKMTCRLEYLHTLHAMKYSCFMSLILHCSKNGYLRCHIINEWKTKDCCSDIKTWKISFPGVAVTQICGHQGADVNIYVRIPERTWDVRCLAVHAASHSEESAIYPSIGQRHCDWQLRASKAFSTSFYLGSIIQIILTDRIKKKILL